MILAASAMSAGAQGFTATANWVTPINANNGISTPEAVAASDNNTFLVSKFVSKNINNLRCKSEKYATSRTYFMFSRNPQTIANTRKTRNHNGYGFSFSLS